MKDSYLDRLLFYLSLAGLCGLVSMGGMAAAHYYFNIPQSGFVADALNAVKTWHRALYTAKHRAHQIASTAPLTINAKTHTINSADVSGYKSRTYGNYTLISLRFSSTVYLLDMNGRVVHLWDMPFSKAWPNPTHVHSVLKARTFVSKALAFSNGDLLAQYMGAGDTPYGYGMLKMDKDSNVLWTYDANSHHDFHVDREGNIYAIVHEIIEKPAGYPDFMPATLLTDYIVKLSPEGKEMERVSLLDAFFNSEFAPLLKKRKRIRRNAWDYFHTNSVMKLDESMASAFPMFKPGQILVTIRSLNAIAMLDLTTRKVVWAHRGGWKWPHAAQFLANGRIMLLDNLWPAQNGLASRVVEIDPASKKTVWQFPSNQLHHFQTSMFGRLQRLPNGNTLIAESMRARILEVTEDGDIVWHYSFNRMLDNSIMTATRYTESELPFLK